MDAVALVDHLSEHGDRLAAAADRAGWDTAVPGTDWTVRQLVRHVGGVHRWAADVVDAARPSGDTPAAAAVGSGPPDDELLEWFQNGHAALVQTLRDAPPDLDCFTFLPADSPLHFWARRQAHETAVHRADAESAAGDVTPFDAAFAQDGIAELLLGFARRRSNSIPRSGVIGLDAADGDSWLVTLGGERTEAETSEDLLGTDVTVRGLSSDLYLWLWNRPTEAVVDGDADLARAWGATVQVTWS